MPTSDASKRKSEAGLAIGVVGILVIMMLPMPAFVMDILLAANIAFSLLMLCVALYLHRPLEFTVFPSLLLVATMARLALNVATTRLILLHGHEGTHAAGQVIETFGQFVVGGNFVVGGIIFLILVLINFIVITKGSERVAEVSARFTLDAMPGKQMAIDSELAAGAITDVEAQTRRREVEMEADFHGAMDGSSKFVRGDAIAGLIITAINIVGGLIIGSVQQSMPISEAAMTYTLLTIGDGLVSQLPALMISTSAGIVMTRSSSESGLSADLSSQIGRHKPALRVVSVVLALLALVPGMPSLIMLGMAGVMFWFSSDRTEEEPKTPEVDQMELPPTETADILRSMLPVDDMELEFGYALVKLVEGDEDGSLLSRIKAIRKQFAMEQGFIVPPVHIRDNLRLEPDVYRVLIRGVEVGRGRLMADRLMAMDPGMVTDVVEGVPGEEPAFGMDAVWIDPGNRSQAETAGYTVVDCSTVIATHLTELTRRNAAELLGRQEAQELVEVVAQKAPKLVEELIPGILPLGDVVKVLKMLLEEEVSIRDLAHILEILSDEAPRNRDPFALVETIRTRLAGGICQRLADPQGTIHAVFLDGQTERLLRERLVHTERGPALAIDILQSRQLVSRLQEVSLQSPQNPLLVTAADLRRALSNLLRQFISQLAVLSHAEVQPRAQVHTLGTISLEPDGSGSGAGIGYEPTPQTTGV
jgi:flagellar biosynthesis protein FlhA